MRVAHTPLADLELVAGDLFERWDADMRSGKLLTALSGHMAPGYDPRVDRVRSALLAFPDLLEALLGCIPQLELGNGEAEHIKAARAAITKATQGPEA